MSEKNLRDAEERLRQAEEERRSAESGYRQAIKLDLSDIERLAAYAELKAARSKEQVARIELVRLQEASASPSWAPVSDIDIYEAADRAAGEALKAEGKDQAGVLNALRKARESLTLSENLGIAERIEAYAYVFEHVLKDDRGFFLFADSCEKMARNWVSKMETDDVETQTASILKAYFPDIAKLFVKNVAEYQRRKEEGQRALFSLDS